MTGNACRDELCHVPNGLCFSSGPVAFRATLVMPSRGRVLFGKYLQTLGRQIQGVHGGSDR